jgi:hypothetical protein
MTAAELEEIRRWPASVTGAQVRALVAEVDRLRAGIEQMARTPLCFSWTDGDVPCHLMADRAQSLLAAEVLRG